jgi:hypothetical protein
MTTETRSSSCPPSFGPQAEQAILRLREAFADIIGSVNGDACRPHEVTKAFGVDKQLGWKIAKLVETGDPFSAGRHLPGPGGIRIFLERARRCKVSPELLSNANSAVQELDELVARHAGDRSSFDLMLSCCSDGGAEQKDWERRRESFRGNSFIWGVQAKTRLGAFFMAPGAVPGRLDVAAVYGFVGLRRLRPNVPWVITRSFCTTTAGQARNDLRREPLDPRGLEHDGESTVPLVRGFCSEPLPEFHRVGVAPGYVEEEIVGGEVGNTGAVTCIAGEILRGGMSYYRDAHNQHHLATSTITTPCETLIFDQIIHEQVFGRIEPELIVYSALGPGDRFPGGRPDRLTLAVSERVERIGRGASVLRTAHMPRYPELARYVFQRMGWEGNAFEVYRVEMRFPPMPSYVVMRHELQNPPGNAAQRDVPPGQT